MVFEYFFKSVDKINISLKSDKTNGYITRTPTYIYDNLLKSS